jgi:peptide/nickel transport system ATP-binding protein
MAELPGSFIHRYPSELSGGEKQRICIAWALAVDPDLIFCDDVISALNQLVAEGVLKLLQHLRPELGVSFPFITHALATIKAIADEIILMLNGRIVEPGNRNPVLNPPHHTTNCLSLRFRKWTRNGWIGCWRNGRCLIQAFQTGAFARK